MVVSNTGKRGGKDFKEGIPFFLKIYSGGQTKISKTRGGQEEGD